MLRTGTENAEAVRSRLRRPRRSASYADHKFERTCASSGAFVHAVAARSKLDREAALFLDFARFRNEDFLFGGELFEALQDFVL
jgi:hypothetical protein